MEETIIIKFRGKFKHRKIIKRKDGYYIRINRMIKKLGKKLIQPISNLEYYEVD